MFNNVLTVSCLSKRQSIKGRGTREEDLPHAGTHPNGLNSEAWAISKASNQTLRPGLEDGSRDPLGHHPLPSQDQKQRLDLMYHRTGPYFNNSEKRFLQ